MQVKNNNTKPYNPSFKGITKYAVKVADSKNFSDNVISKIKTGKGVIVCENPFYPLYEYFWATKMPHKNWIVQNLKNQNKNIAVPKGLIEDETLSVFLFTGKDIKKYQKKFESNNARIKEKVSLVASVFKDLIEDIKNPSKVDLYNDEISDALYCESSLKQSQKSFDKFLKNKKIKNVEYKPKN